MRVARSSQDAPKAGNKSTKDSVKKGKFNQTPKGSNAEQSMLRNTKEKKVKKSKASNVPSDSFQGVKAEILGKMKSKKKLKKKMKKNKALLVLHGDGQKGKTEKSKSLGKQKGKINQTEVKMEKRKLKLDEKKSIEHKDGKKQIKDKNVKFDKVGQKADQLEKRKKKSVVSKKIFARNRLAKKFKKGKM